MDSHDPEIDAALRGLSRLGREVRPAGFADRALRAVRRDVARRRIIRWSAISAPLAACAAALVVLLGPPPGDAPASEHEIAQLLALHDQVVRVAPSLEDADALAAMVLAEFEAASALPRLEGGDEALARLILGS